MVLILLAIAAEVVCLFEGQEVGFHIDLMEGILIVTKPHIWGAAHLKKSLFGEDFNSPLQGHHMLEALAIDIQYLVISKDYLLQYLFLNLMIDNLISAL